MSDSDPSPDAASSRRLRNVFGFKRKAVVEVDIEPDEDKEAASATPQEIRLRLDEFAQMKVRDVMVPRAEIKAVEVATTFPDLLSYFSEVKHSRLPVFRETLDDPIGFVHIKDIVAAIADGNSPDLCMLEKLYREPLYVPPSMKLTVLLVKMQTTRIHLGIVVDEHGGTDGLVSLEDLMEEIVGDIEDEHDDEEAMFMQRSPRIWEANARTEIEDFAEETGIDLSLADIDTEIDTLGGVASALAGRVPVRGEVLIHPTGVEIEIIDADARRLRRLRLHIPETGETPRSQE